MLSVAPLTIAPLMGISLMGVLALALGLQGLRRRQVTIISARWMFVFVLAGLGPTAFPRFHKGLAGMEEHLQVLNLMQLLNFLVILVVLRVFWKVSQGYLMIGITESSTREGLRAALKKLELPHEETLGSIRLQSVGADIQVGIQPWVGTAQLNIKGSQFSGLLRSIADAMKDHYGESSAPVNLSCYYLQIALGAILLVMAAALALM